MRAAETPYDEVLGRWLAEDVMSGEEPFHAERVLAALDRKQQTDLRLTLDGTTQSLLAPGELGTKFVPSAPGQTIAYVPEGSFFERRVTNAGLYADQVIVNKPSGIWPPLSQQPGGPNKWAEELLDFAWAIRQPLADGWLHIVERVNVANENLAMLRLDEEFCGSLRERFARTESLMQPRDPAVAELQFYEAYENLFNAAYVATSMGTPAVLTLPPEPISVALFEVSARYFRFEDIPHYLHPNKEDFRPPPRVLTTASQGQLLRGQWFDELLVGLGPITAYLDGSAVCSLRSRGIAAELRHFLATDLNELAFSFMEAGTVQGSLERRRLDLQQIAERIVAAVDVSRSATIRDRLRLGGIGGMSGLASGFLGTMLTSGSPAMASAVAGIGFALGAAGSVAGTAKREPAVSHPFLIDVMRAARAPAG